MAVKVAEDLKQNQEGGFMKPEYSAILAGVPVLLTVAYKRMKTNRAIFLAELPGRAWTLLRQCYSAKLIAGKKWYYSIFFWHYILSLYARVRNYR